MDKCKITQDQINTLLSGKSATVKYRTLEEYGQVFTHEIELVPVNSTVKCVNCGSTDYAYSTITLTGDNILTGHCNLCE